MSSLRTHLRPATLCPAPAPRERTPSHSSSPPSEATAVPQLRDSLASRHRKPPAPSGGRRTPARRSRRLRPAGVATATDCCTRRRGTVRAREGGGSARPRLGRAVRPRRGGSRSARAAACTVERTLCNPQPEGVLSSGKGSGDQAGGPARWRPGESGLHSEAGRPHFSESPCFHLSYCNATGESHFKIKNLGNTVALAP